MTDTLYLAWQYLKFHRVQSLLLIVALALIISVPVTLNRVLAAADAQLTARAEQTPLLVGARGSRLDLAMSSLYFSDDSPETITMASSERIWDSGLATAIPLYNRFRVQETPIIGTTLDYFRFRGLELASGRDLAILGEAVLGAAVAERRALSVGDAIVSSPDNLFDLAGAYPLKMKVVGVLEPTGSADDEAVFVDVKTAWVIEGIGHGHEDIDAEDTVGSDEPDNRVASGAVTQFREITEDNIDSFHFHGDPDQYPLTGVIAVPHDEKSATLLRGRYVDPDNAEQIVVPAAVIGSLLEHLFVIKAVFDVIIWVVALAAGLSIALAIFLSLQLRKPEMNTIYKLGSQRLTMLRLVSTEGALVLLCSLALATILTLSVQPLAESVTAGLLSGF